MMQASQDFSLQEMYRLLEAVHDGVINCELTGPGDKIHDLWFSWRCAENRLVNFRSWQDCAVNFERIRHHYGAAYAQAALSGKGSILDLSFVSQFCKEPMDSESENQSESESESESGEEWEVSENPDFLREIMLINRSLFWCSESIKVKGAAGNHLLSDSCLHFVGRKSTSKYLRDNFEIAGKGGRGTFTRESLGELLNDLTARLGILSQ